MFDLIELRAKNVRDWLLSLPRWIKRLLLVANDLVILGLALWISVSINRGSILLPTEWSGGWTFIAAPIFGAFAYHYFGSYKQVTRFFGHFGSHRILMGTLFAMIALSLALYFSGTNEFPISILVMFGLLSGYLIVASRNIASWFLNRTEFYGEHNQNSARTNILIYGAGEAGNQLRNALQFKSNFRPVGYVDDNKDLWRSRINGLKVYPPLQLADIVKRENVKEIFIAIPSLDARERRKVYNSLVHYNLILKTLPAIEDLASGRISYSDLRRIDVEDLLGREPVDAKMDLLTRSITGRAVLITGAGGSIGSELARQIYDLGPRKLILLDQSESALYQISSEILDRKQENSDLSTLRDEPELKTILGSILDRTLIERSLRENPVDTVFHAAAYKHVPIVEQNPVTGILNNTFGTKVLCDICQSLGIDKFVLISTDKAVRPTNIMGASKRFAELILQGIADKNLRSDISDGSTKFTMVRFGNVLNSSGSVVPKFSKQINEGGPITVTHRDMERYFMSIPEAVQLVIQAAALAESGGVYVLDMGEPVKISSLARTMIELSGLQVLDDNNPEGDIAIEYTGLRPGEKIKEELLISDTAEGTEHHQILKNREPFIEFEKLDAELNKLLRACETNNLDSIKSILKNNVEGYEIGNGQKETVYDYPNDQVVSFPLKKTV